MPHNKTQDLGLFVDRLFPTITKLINMGYFHLEVQGLGNVPIDGPVIYAMNHAGWFALDGIMGNYVLWNNFGLEQMACAAVHDPVLELPGLGPVLSAMGGIPASALRHLEDFPPEISKIGIFPEGAEGNTKPFWQAYRMKPWKTGFVHLAEHMKARIVPVAILGSEECLPSVWALKSFQKWLHSPLPIPLSLIPLPSRWKFTFHQPYNELVNPTKVARPGTFYHEVADRLSDIVQQTLNRQTKANPIGIISRAASILHL